ncbi:MAG: TolC family protein [Azonexus sp.]|nr:TolC family protein [Azonexus sp.]MDZ4313210.1 TolC family protein [Azonexus sp.]
MRHLLWIALLLVAAQPVRSEPIQTLAQAYAAAWQRKPAGQAVAERENALRSRRLAADALTPEPPSIELRGRTDRFNQQRGANEQEIGLVLPLWLPGEQSASQALAEAEIGALGGRMAALRLQLAGEVRDAWWGWQLAGNEQTLAAERVVAARRLLNDVARRVAAGDLSRADQHQAAGALAAAEAQQAEARVALESTRFRLQSLTGQLPSAVGPVPETLPDELPGVESSDEHPLLRDLQARGDVSRRSLELTRARSRNNPQIVVGTRLERALTGDPIEQTWALALRIPFSSGPRNDARLAEANADLIESRLQFDRQGERLGNERAAAEAQLLAVRQLLAAAELRAQLAAENRGFFDKSFRLGETDLPTRLRIELEAFEAERLASRARINLAQRISAQRQALGLLPE